MAQFETRVLTSLLISFALISSSVRAQAGILELLSSGAYYVGTAGGCESFDERSASFAVSKAIPFCVPKVSSPQTLFDFASDLQYFVGQRTGVPPENRAQRALSGDFETDLFGLLGRMHVDEMRCMAGFAHKTASAQGREVRERLGERIQLIRAAKQALNAEIRELASDTTMMEKVCPSRLEDLSPAGPGSNRERCERIVRTRSMFQTLQTSLPLSGVPSFAKFVDQYANQSESLSDSDFDLKLQAQLVSAVGDLKNGAREIHQASSQGQTSRAQKYQLLQDPYIRNRILEASGHNRDLKGAFCRADSRYGKGADYLSNAAMVGATLASGGAGWLARAGLAVKTTGAAANAVRLSPSVVRSLEVANRGLAYGATPVFVADQIQKRCGTGPFRQLPERKEAEEPTACEQFLDIKQIEQDSCILGVLYSAVAVATTPIGKDLLSATHKMLEPLGKVYGVSIEGSLNQLVTRRYRALAEAPGIKVEGTTFSSRQLAQKVAEDIYAFDQAAEKLGFRVPESTRVIMGDGLLLPRQKGPFAFPHPTRSAWDGKVTETAIVMDPLGWRKGVIRSRSALLHERAHTHMHGTYGQGAFVNSDLATQEALVDFVVAHRFGNPVIGMHAEKAGQPVRDISQLWSQGIVQDRPFALRRAGGPHHEGIYRSNALWEVREAIGSQQMDKLVKPIIDDLNIFSRYSSRFGFDSNASFKYFLASVRNTLQTHGKKDGVAVIDRIIQKNEIKDDLVGFSNSMSRTTATGYHISPAPYYQRPVAAEATLTRVVTDKVGRSLLVLGMGAAGWEAYRFVKGVEIRDQDK